MAVNFAFNIQSIRTDAQRRANKPEDVTPEEWDYMINYFGTDLKFQVTSVYITRCSK